MLIVELTRLGDVVTMLPSLVRLRAFCKTARIQVLVDDRYLSLLTSLRFDLEFFGIKHPGTPAGMNQAVRLARRIRADLAVSMSPPRRNAFVTLSSGARFMIGYLRYVDSVTPFLVSTPVESFGFQCSPVAQYERENIYKRGDKICTALGMDGEGRQLHFDVDPDVHCSVRTALEQRMLIPRRDYVILFPFSGWEFRNWDLSKFMALAERIIQSLHYDVLLCCEERDSRRFERHIPRTSGISVVGSKDLLDVAVLMRGARLVVGNDSGPLHLAAALNVRTVGIFGPASPDLTGPKSGTATNIYKRVECSPCDQRGCVRPERPCMSLHEVNEVFAAVCSALDAKKNLELLNADG